MNLIKTTSNHFVNLNATEQPDTSATLQISMHLDLDLLRNTIQ